jgi:glycosyltransferase involved in cell wall biosynthesis
MGKLKVLHIGKYYHPYNGGMEKSLYTSVNELKKDIDFTVLAANNSRRTVTENNGLTVVRLANFGSIFSQPVVPGIFFWLRRLKADIVHLHLPNPLGMISYLISCPRTKLVVSYHSDVIRQKHIMLLLNPVLKFVLRKAEVIVVTSDNLINSSSLLQEFRCKCRVIPHGVDINNFELNKDELAKAETIRRGINKPLVLFVGRLVYYKGLEYLIRAMKKTEAQLVIVGTGPQKEKLLALAKNMKLEKKISWTGEISDERLRLLYAACDLFVLPSCYNSESFGLVILEAHAAGKPVVSTDLPTGVTFANLHNHTGLVVPCKDSEALAGAINQLIFSADLRQEYGSQARQRVKKEFSKELVSQKLLTLYNTISNN